MAIDDALDLLCRAPQTFLADNAMIIYGSNKGGSGVKEFVLQGTEKTGWKSCAGGAAKDVPFYVLYEASSFNGQGSGPKSTPFTAHYISMREYDVKTGAWEDTSATHYALPGTGAEFLVTSKLNGCTFGIGSNAEGSRLVSHLRPPMLAGHAGRLRLDEGTRTGFTGGKLEKSVMSSQEQNGTVFGVRNGASWTFYAQRFQMFATAVGTITDIQVYS